MKDRHYLHFSEVREQLSPCNVMAGRRLGAKSSLDVCLRAPSPWRSLPYVAATLWSCRMDNGTRPRAEIHWSRFLFVWSWASALSSLELILVEVPPVTALSLGLKSLWQTNFLLQVISSVFRAYNTFSQIIQNNINWKL